MAENNIESYHFNKQGSKTRSKQTAVLFIILISYLIIVLDISIVITALPEMQIDLGFSATGLSWIQNAYTLTFGGLLLLGARIGDILGRRRMFIIGIGLFGIASLTVGLSQSVTWIIAGRVLQGIGAAILAPSTLALLTANFAEGQERTRAVAYYGAIAGIGASLGFVLGGILTDWISWRVGFFINIPIGAAMMIAAPRYLTETDHIPGKFDLVGAISSTLGMTALVYGIVRSATAGWDDALTVEALVAGILLLALFIINEWRATQPIMPLRLFKSRQRTGAYLARILFLGAMMGFWFFITQFLQSVREYSPLEAGLAFLPMTATNFIIAVNVPKFTRRYGNARLLAGGLIITLIGMAWLSRLSADISYFAGVALPMILIGIGQGASLGPLTASGIAGVDPEDAGAASGLVNVAHQLGGSLGLGILVTIYAAASSINLSERDLLTHRISTALTASTVMLALAFIIVVLMIVWTGKRSKV
ncbi:MFS transporter [Paenibacillus sp. PL91]|uniref:MFS transporter n=1 Tax=Paenibacillus sp. PL91 TaxID=2729538 RepID=UPI00145F7728|nr:MFS transporter [Paenibacillus sp. PL91]MBC9199263.1 MFS transporter [Paenibacillus sp. PL91]